MEGEKREGKEGYNVVIEGDYDQSTLHACMEVS
jgi:hypothetical protein